MSFLEGSSNLAAAKGILKRLKVVQAVAEECGQIEASRITARVIAAIPDNVSVLAQIGCALEAIEEEDYRSWPSYWPISIFRGTLLQYLTDFCFQDKGITRFQRKNYQQLLGFPRLLQRITHGLTRKLPLSDKQGFIDELISAGRRETSRGDESSAPGEANVVHFALSYKHASSYDKGGTIDYETAEEAYEICCQVSGYSYKGISSYSHARVWIDQNLHRYPTDGPWYERGFLPYATMNVVSALGKPGGFGIALRRPWIWIETGLALNGLGIYCRQDICSTTEEVIVYPEKSSIGVDIFRLTGHIIGNRLSVFDSVSRMLRSVAWWIPDMLSHKDYEYANEFGKFVHWSQAQIVRLEKKGKLDLSSDRFEDTILENICWMRALPINNDMRQEFQSPYLRLEMDIGKARKQLALLQASGKCRQQDGVYEFLGKAGLETFCFTVSTRKVCLDVNPSRRQSNLSLKGDEKLQDPLAEVKTMSTWRGGYCLWDKRFPPHEIPRFIYCGTIFGQQHGMKHSLGEEPCNITLGGFSFTRKGFLTYGIHVEGVYVSQLNDEEIFLCESDVLCIRELPEDLQKELINSLSPTEAFPSMCRILKAESDITNARLTTRTIGTTTEDIEVGIQAIKGEDVGPDEINIRRIRIGEYLHILLINDHRLGRSVYTFETSVKLESLFHLMHFKMGDDIDMTLTKIRLMMGSNEFSCYARDGLSLGIGTYNGTEKYPHELRLEGSEFVLCEECDMIYSPINLMECSLSSNMRKRKMKARWGKVHKCSGGVRPCDIIGEVE